MTGALSCYDGGECIRALVCRPGSCQVRQGVEQLRSQQFESSDTVISPRLYVGEKTEVIDLNSEVPDIREATYSFLPSGVTNIFRPNHDLTEEEVQMLRDRFEKIQHNAQAVWYPQKPVREIQSDHNRRHICLVCMFVSWLPGHHRCPHGRLVCERCEVEAAGW
jgi:hypothetical protein